MANAQHSERNFDRTKAPHFDAKRESCATCRFWLPGRASVFERDNPSELSFGFCRRRAPAVVGALVPIVVGTPGLGDHRDEALTVADACDISAFPGVYQNEWCGEFEWLPRLQPTEMPVC